MGQLAIYSSSAQQKKKKQARLGLCTLQML
jgi:hypothetical protein